MLDVNSLCELIKLHERTPLSSQDYKVLFEECGLADLKVLDEARSRLDRNGTMLHAVMDCLASQSNDGETGGTLSVRELYFLVKARNGDLSATMSEIGNMLAFLSSPMINCVGKTKDEYYAIGSLNEASNKFSFYANACFENQTAMLKDTAMRKQRTMRTFMGRGTHRHLKAKRLDNKAPSRFPNEI